MNLWLHLTVVWLAAGVAMAAGWQGQRRRSNAGIVDVVWAAGVGSSAAYYAVMGDGAALPRVTLAVLGGAWGLRLAMHLWLRVRGEAEDGRYRHLRVHWRGDQPRFFLFFQFQAVLIVLFSLPFLAVARNQAAGITAWWVAGIVIWLASVGGEWVADRQLARFRAKASNRGRVCRQGLWRYSRHPNYFFEWMHWFAFPYTEAQALRTRGEDYRDYQRTTPMLFPWFPKRSPG